MPGPNSRFTEKGDRQAKHVEMSELKRGGKSMTPKKARSIGYAVATKSGFRRKGK